MQIEPGDTMTASVNVTTTNVVTLTLKNDTRHTLAVERAKASVVDLSSAEWMIESPNSCTNGICSGNTLADFSPATISKLQATANGQSGTLTDPAWIALPTEIGSSSSTSGTCTPVPSADGSSFKVIWVPAGAANC